MKIYKIAFRNFLDILTNNLSRKISNYIRQMYLRTGIRSDNKNFGAFTDEIPKPQNITVNVDIMRMIESRTPPFAIKGGYKKLPNLHKIFLNTMIFSNFSDKYFDALDKVVVQKIKHELEHLRQNKTELTSNPTKYDVSKFRSSDPQIVFAERVKYISDAKERGARIRGMMMVAKKTNTPIETLIDKFIFEQLYNNDSKNERFIKDNNLNAQNIEDAIRNNYYAKTREIFRDYKF